MTSRKRRHLISAGALKSAVFRTEGTIEGYVFNPEQLGQRLVVELWLDGWPYQVRRADLVDRRSPVADTDAQHGFCFSLPHSCSAREAEVRLANTPIVLGSLQDLTSRLDVDPLPHSAGAVHWAGGLLIEGYLSTAEADEARARGIIDETIVFDVAPVGWTHVTRGDDLRPVRRFEAHLPIAYGDGRVHRLDVVTSDGQTLAGSPIDIIVYIDGLEQFIAGESGLVGERLRARVFDALTPRSVPFAWIDAWTARFPLKALSPSIASVTVAVVVIGEEKVEDTVASLEACETPWVLGVLSCEGDTLQFDTADLRAFLDHEAAPCETVVVAGDGTRFHPRMAGHFASALADDEGIAFADIVVEQGPGGARLPLAYSGFDLERLLEQGAGTLLFAMRRKTILAAAAEPRMSVFELFLHAFDAIGESRPIHIPGFLGACPAPDPETASKALARAVGSFLKGHGTHGRIEVAEGTALPAVHLARTTSAEQITVIVPVRDRLDDLRKTVDAIRAIRSRHGLDLHIVDMASSDEAVLSYMRSLTGHHQHVYRSDEPFNTGRALNRAVGSVRTRYILFLEPGCVFAATDAIEELVGRCAEPDVAAAGPLLVTGDSIVEAAGLVGSTQFAAVAAFAGLSQDDPGDADLLRVARSCSALPLTGMLTRRRDFLGAGGFDSDRLSRHLFGFDYGLKLRRQGKRLVFTPHARLILPRGRAFHGDLTEAERQRPGIRGEVEAMRSIWGDALLADDLYSPSLALTRRPFTALAWPPRRGSLHAPVGEPPPDRDDGIKPSAARSA